MREREREQLVAKLLSNKIIRFFGLISYSIYIWHFPIFSFLRQIDIFENSIITKLLSILLIIVLSTFTFFFIEQPFRKKIGKRKVYTIILVFTILLISINLYTIKNKGLQERFPPIIKEIIDQQLEFTPIKFEQTRNNFKEIIAIGDSLLNSISGALYSKLTNYKFSFFGNNFLYIENFVDIDNSTKKEIKQYTETRDEIKSYLNNNQNKIIIIFFRWTDKIEEKYTDKYNWVNHYLEPKNVKTNSQKERQNLIEENLIKTFKNISNGNKLILIYPLPELPFDPKLILTNKYILNKILGKKEVPIISVDYKEYIKKNYSTINLLDKIKGDNIYRIYPAEIFCDNQIKDECIINNSEHLFYRDSVHLSPVGGKYLADKIFSKIKEIEKQNK
jgi:hypothetical protein